MAGKPTRNRCNYEWFAGGYWRMCTRGKGHPPNHEDRRERCNCGVLAADCAGFGKPHTIRVVEGWAGKEPNGNV